MFTAIILNFLMSTCRITATMYHHLMAGGNCCAMLLYVCGYNNHTQCPVFAQTHHTITDSVHPVQIETWRTFYLITLYYVNIFGKILFTYLYQDVGVDL